MLKSKLTPIIVKIILIDTFISPIKIFVIRLNISFASNALPDIIFSKNSESLSSGKISLT